MNKDVKGFVADIDMTLTTKGNSLPAITVKALEILHKHGYLLGLATGRVMNDDLKKQGAIWGLSFEFDYLICMNGGQVYDSHSGKLDEKKYLTCEDEKEIIETLLDVVNENNISINAEGLGNIFSINNNGALAEVMKRHGWDYVDVTNNVEQFWSKPTYKLLFRCPFEQDLDPNKLDEDNFREVLSHTRNRSYLIRERYNEKLKDKYDIVESFPGTLEIMHKGINKGAGLETYASWYNLTANDFIAFGDSENDNVMLEKAGWAVALENANEKTKQIADEVTKLDCMQGGVGDYLFENIIIPKGLDQE